MFEFSTVFCLVIAAIVISVVWATTSTRADVERKQEIDRRVSVGAKLDTKVRKLRHIEDWLAKVVDLLDGDTKANRQKVKGIRAAYRQWRDSDEDVDDIDVLESEYKLVRNMRGRLVEAEAYADQAFKFSCTLDDLPYEIRPSSERTKELDDLVQSTTGAIHDIRESMGWKR